MMDDGLNHQSIEEEGLQMTSSLSTSAKSNGVPEAAEKGLNADSPSQNTVKDVKDSKSNQQFISESRIKRWNKRMRFQPKNVVIDKEDQHEYYKKFLNSSEKEDFEIPRVVSVMEHANACTKEIEAMMSAIKQHAGSKTALQTLPRHLRRRAASHNVKRLPRRLRELAKQQAAQPEKINRNHKATISRRKRRRKPDLQKEYAKRADKQGWLETHVWHAKRFHMSDSEDAHFSEWKHRIALHANDKCFKACYRAVAKHCLMQDISYYKCLELSGSRYSILNIFKSITCISSSLPIFNDSVLAGDKEGCLLLYNKQTVPYQCLGPCSVIWRPVNETSDCNVWVWLHPAIFTLIHSTMEDVTKNSKETIKIKDISENLIRFRLNGPKSSVTLLSCLRFYQHNKLQESSEKNINQWLVSKKELLTKQYKDFISVMKDRHQKYCRKVKDKTRMKYDDDDDGSVYSIIANDPRLTLPLQRTVPSFKATNDACGLDDAVTPIEEFSCDTPLWVTSILKQVSDSRSSDHVVSTRKSEAKFASEDEKSEWAQSLSTPIPVMVVRRAGYVNLDPALTNHERTDISKYDQNSDVSTPRGVHDGPVNGFAAGWDLILPANWAMAFWIPLIYHMARPGGLRENKRIQLECKLPHFPEDYPETRASSEWWKAEAKMNHDKYYRKPPSKRPNFSVLATPFPFAPCWEYLFSDDRDTWSRGIQDAGNASSNAVAVGSRDDLDSHLSQKKATNLPHMQSGDVTLHSVDEVGNTTKLRPNLKRPQNIDSSEDNPRKKMKLGECSLSFCVLRDGTKLKVLQQLLHSFNYVDVTAFLREMENDYPHCLICVKVTPMDKGVPLPQATLNLPTAEDLINLKERFDETEYCFPAEPPHWDPYRKERKSATKEAKKRRKCKDKLKPPVIQKKPFFFNVFPSRKIIGFVTSGDFLFSHASGGGIGFVTLQSLQLLCQLCHDQGTTSLSDKVGPSKLLALMRNITSSQYRFITLDVVF